MPLSARGWAANVKLYRDAFGVPSIVADKLPDAVYGLGYAMAQDNAERMALNFKQARGRLAEVEGRSQLLTDGFLRSLGLEEIAEQKAHSLQGETALLLQSFCDGANRALAEQKDRLPKWIEPFTLTDVLAMMQLTNASFALSDIASQLLPGAGSNQFAVAARRSATGHAILSADPHLPWDGVLLWYEFALYTKEFHFRGITLSGLPFGIMGHTDRVAWCMTNNDPRLFDFLTVQTNPANPKQYNYHGEWRDFEEKSIEIRYRDGDQMKSLTQKVRRTAWGPMVPFRSQAARLSMLGDWDLLDEPLQMARAKDARQFREALRPLGLSMWNIVYADTKGHIGYQYNARVPKRDPSFDWTKPVPGADSKTRWGAPWTLDELPHVEDPRSNLLVNCNSAPWLTPLDDEIKSEGWPAYVTTYGHTTRFDRLSALLAQDPHVTVEAAKRYATDTQVPYVLKTVRALQQSDAVKEKLKAEEGAENALREALGVLAAWDGRADLDSRGGGLWVYWMRADRRVPGLARKAEEGATWSADEIAVVLTALEAAATAMKKDHGRLDVPWSDLHVTQRGDQTVPIIGYGYVAPGDASAAVAATFGLFQKGQLVCSGGSSFRMIVDLDPHGVRSWTILPYGESQDPKNPHFADQLPLFSRGVYKDTAFGVAQLRKGSVSQQTLR